MNVYGARSLAVLHELHPDLQLVFQAVLSYRDHSLIDGKRTMAEQVKFVEKGVSKTLNSRHLPRNLAGARVADNDPTGVAWAVDATPYPFVGWDHPKYRDDLLYFSGFVVAIAVAHGIVLRPGCDWNRDGLVSNNGFEDLDHWELLLPPGVT